jgi:hypothetical protein
MIYPILASDITMMGVWFFDLPIVLGLFVLGGITVHKQWRLVGAVVSILLFAQLFFLGRICMRVYESDRVVTLIAALACGFGAIWFLLMPWNRIKHQRAFQIAVGMLYLATAMALNVVSDTMSGPEAKIVFLLAMIFSFAVGVCFLVRARKQRTEKP